MINETFDRDIAFSRNIGLLSEEEHAKIKNFVIAIPGMGGAGGAHLISLVRQGFEKFKISDFDEYELKNFNRQYGARMDTLGRKKAEVMREEALKINPNCDIEIFDAITEQNVQTFLSGVHLLVDAVDFFVLEIRRLLINESMKMNIPTVSAAPIGFSVAFLIFMPGGPNFDKYFAVHDGLSFEQKVISFAVGLIPSMLQRSYMKKTNLKEKRGPSSIAAINMCAAVSTTYALKILLKRGEVKAVPYYHQFDLMTDKYVVKKLWLGNRNPMQRLKIKIADKLMTD